jgi:hypothetical protein
MVFWSAPSGSLALRYKKIMTKKKKELFVRITCGSLGILLILAGVITLLKGRLHYSNSWGGAVFAYFPILGGILLLFLVVSNKINNL